MHSFKCPSSWNLIKQWLSLSYVMCLMSWLEEIYPSDTPSYNYQMETLLHKLWRITSGPYRLVLQPLHELAFGSLQELNRSFFLGRTSNRSITTSPVHSVFMDVHRITELFCCFHGFLQLEWFLINDLFGLMLQTSGRILKWPHFHIPSHMYCTY